MVLTKRIIPCLDIKDGRVVKGTNFLGLRDAGDPVELAARYNEQGADEVVFLDITASKEGRGTIVEVIERAADQLFLPLTVGGGIRTTDDIRLILRAGADKVSVNTSAVERPELITEGANAFGTQCIVVAMDVRRNFEPNPDGTPIALGDGRTCWYEVVTYGGRRPTGIDAIAWVREAERRGAGEVLLTSMETDGTKDGFDLAITAAVSDAVGIPVIASGGVGTLAHFYDGFVTGKADAALAASVFHYGELTVRDVKEYLAGRGVPGPALRIRGAPRDRDRRPATGWSRPNAPSTSGCTSPNAPMGTPSTTIAPRRPSMKAGSSDSTAVYARPSSRQRASATAYASEKSAAPWHETVAVPSPVSNPRRVSPTAKSRCGSSRNRFVLEELHQEREERGPGHGLLLRDRVEEPEHVRGRLPAHAGEEHVVARQHERHGLEVPEAAERLAHVPFQPARRRLLGDRRGLRRHGLEPLVPVRDRDVLEDVPVVHDVRAVARHLDPDAVGTHRLGPEPHAPEQGGHGRRIEVEAEEPAALADRDLAERRRERRRGHAVDLDRLEPPAGLGERGAEDLSSRSRPRGGPCPCSRGGRRSSRSRRGSARR